MGGNAEAYLAIMTPDDQFGCNMGVKGTNFYSAVFNNGTMGSANTITLTQSGKFRIRWLDSTNTFTTYYHNGSDFVAYRNAGGFELPSPAEIRLVTKCSNGSCHIRFDNLIITPVIVV